MHTVTASVTSGYSLGGRPPPPMWDSRPTWPAQAVQAARPADWPRLAAAWGSLEHDLALKGASGEPAGRGLSQRVSHMRLRLHLRREDVEIVRVARQHDLRPHLGREQRHERECILGSVARLRERLLPRLAHLGACVEKKVAQPQSSASWHSGGSCQRQSMPQTARSFGQPRPTSCLGRINAGRQYRPCFRHSAVPAASALRSATLLASCTSASRSPSATTSAESSVSR